MYIDCEADVVERVGVYGGSFDPVHIGHLAMAEEVRWACDLQRILLVPAAQQPLKAAPHGAAAVDRLAMLQHACVGNPALQPSDIELHRNGPSYTIDTLELLRDRLGSTVELVFILGADALIDLPRWHRAAELVALTHFAVVARPEYQVDLDMLEAALPGLHARITWVRGPLLAISSSDLRERCAQGKPIRYQVPEPVWEYIQAHRLYRPPAYM